MKIRPKHLQFCMHYLETGDPGVSYKMTYPKAGIKSLYAAASRLMARPDVSAWIEETRNGMQERLLRQIEDAQVQAKKQQLLSITEKRAVLTGLILGETKRTRHIRTKYGVTKVEDDQPIYAILRAIDLDTRLENFQNYLLHRDSFTAPQPNVYINTPAPQSTTLVEQVNILIARCEAESVSPPKEGEDLSPAACPQQSWRGGGVRSELVPQSAGGVEPRHGGAQDKASPFRGGLEGALAKISSPPYEGGENDSPAPAEDCHLGEVAPAQDKPPRPGYAPLPYLPLPPKKGPVYLTTVNNRACELVNTIKNNHLVNNRAQNHPQSRKIPLGGQAETRKFAPYIQGLRE